MEHGICRLWLNSRWLQAAFVVMGLAVWSVSESDALSGPIQTGPSLDFVLTDVDGNEVNLADMRGKPLILNFWATWCGPCKVEVPWLVEFAEKYREQDLTVVGLSVDDSADQIRAFSNRYGVNYLMLVGKGHDDLARAFDAEASIPVTWLIRRDGRVYAKIMGIQSKAGFEQHIQQLF